MFTISSQAVKNDIYVPRYYWKQNIKEARREAAEQGLEFVSLETLIDEGIIKKFRGHGAPPSEYKGRGEVPYVRAADIVNWGLYKNPVAMIPYDLYKQVKGKSGVDLEPLDIVFVKEGSYRIGSVALVSKFDTGVLLNHHSLVFRVVKADNKYGIDPYYLLYLFSHKLTQQQLFNKVMIDTTLPNIGNRWAELNLPVAKDPKVRADIQAKVKAVFDQRWSADAKLEAIRSEFGGLTT